MHGYHSLLHFDLLRDAPLHHRLRTVTLCLHLLQQLLLSCMQFGLALVLHRRLDGLKPLPVCTILDISPEYVIPPPERRRVIVRKRHVVEIVVLRSRPERQDVSQRPREIYHPFSVRSRVRLDDVP